MNGASGSALVYKKPPRAIVAVRSDGARLHDEHGREYLDSYGRVAAQSRAQRSQVSGWVKGDGSHDQATFDRKRARSTE
jgi:hypothetical protein